MDKLLEAINDLPTRDNNIKKLFDEQDDDPIYDVVKELIEEIIEAQEKGENEVSKEIGFYPDERWQDWLDDIFPSKGYNIEIVLCRCSHCNAEYGYCGHNGEEINMIRVVWDQT
jgi:hypothetical protein